jgi:hypothetical protein
MTMSLPATAAMAAAIIVMAQPALAGGGSRGPVHGASAQPVSAARGAPARGHQVAPSHVHDRFGGPRFEQRADPNNQNPYRPMFSLDATPPGQPHPYFQTPKEGFGYPVARPVPVYLGNGLYVIPR